MDAKIPESEAHLMRAIKSKRQASFHFPGPSKSERDRERKRQKLKEKMCNRCDNNKNVGQSGKTMKK